MTRSIEIEPVLDAFLADGSDELADHVIEAALLDIDHTRQRRAVGVPWRYSEMPTIVRLLIAATLAVLALGAAFYVGSNINRSTQTVVVNPSPASGSAIIEIGSDLNGRWDAERPAAFGLPAGGYTLIVAPNTPLLAESLADQRQILLGTKAASNGMVTLAATDRCPTAGTYAYAPDKDLRVLTLSLLADSCADRVAVLVGTWNRTATDQVLAAAIRYSFDLQPSVTFTIPDGFRDSDGSQPTATTGVGDGWRRLTIGETDAFAVIQAAGDVLQDRCVNGATRPQPTTLDAFVAWNRATTGATVSEPVHLKVDGHDAIRLDVVGDAACPIGTLPPNCMCMPHTYIATGTEQRIWGIDLGGQLLLAWFHDDEPPLLPLTPNRIAIADALIASLAID